MLDIEWKDEDWEDLKFSIESNNCILMLGPDAATQEINGRHRPLTEILADELAEEFDAEIKKKINLSDLAQVSQYYHSIKGSKTTLMRKVVKFYTNRQRLCNELHKDLAQLPFYFYITTTHDKMIENALSRKDPIIKWYHFKDNEVNKEPIKMGTFEKPLLFYLYGNLEDQKSLVLTEDDLLDFLKALISEDPSLPDCIRKELSVSEKTLLFLGFGFRHWYLRILLHKLLGRGRSSDSFAMEPSTEGKTPLLDQSAVFFQKSGYKVNIFKKDLNTFVRQLKKECEDILPKTKTFDEEKKPRVFLCHASEDKRYAKFLYDKLREAGLRPWLDKEDLKPGDHWRQVIEEVIESADYFLVLNSKNLVEKDIAFVNREINGALERRKEFRNRLFIIPVRIDDSPLLRELNDFQALNSFDDKSIEKLVRVIKDDFANRRQK